MSNTKSKIALSIFVLIFLVGLVSSFSSYSYINTPTYRPDYQTYYSSADIDTYWPKNLDAQTCSGRQDLILQPAIGGCQPAVVRSDLLEEQNVPVFCQLSAIQLNPLIDIKQIDNIAFDAKYPDGVVTTGFHPARAALSTRDQLLGDPLINNVGYAVVVLKRNPAEKDMPDSVNVNLTATIRYDAGNGYGIGRSEFILKVEDEQEWNQDKNKNSFLDGRMFVRLETLEEDYAVVSIYEGDRKMTTKRVPLNDKSDKIYLPGSYCGVDFQIQFNGYTSVRNTAMIEITTDKGTDNLEVYEGSRFLNSKCYVTRIIPDIANNGRVILSCEGKKITLMLTPKSTDIFFNEANEFNPPKEVDGELIVNFGQNSKIGTFGLGSDGNLFYVNNQGTKVRTIAVIGKDYDKGSTAWLTSLSNYPKDEVGKSNFESWMTKLQDALRQYRTNIQANPDKPRDLIVDSSLSPDAEKQFNVAIDAYKKVFNEFPFEKDSASPNDFIAQSALSNAIVLAHSQGKIKTKAELLQIYIDNYPDALDIESKKKQLSRIYSTDIGLSSTSIEIDHSAKMIRLVSVHNASNKAKIEYSWDTKTSEAHLNQKVTLDNAGNYFILDKVDPRARAETISIYSNCNDFKANPQYYSPDYGYDYDSRPRVNGGYLTIGVGDNVVMCGKTFVLRNIESQSYASVNIVPEIHNGQTVTNVSLTIGIEKRAISLNPDKALERIDNLNKSIEKWESISNRLANVVTAMKSACFVTAGALTFKNFVTGLNGETIARQQAMTGDNGWTIRCRKMIAQGTYSTLTQCFNDNSGKIDDEVNKRAEIINQVNDVISPIEDKYDNDGGLLEDRSINSDKAKADLADIVKKECSSMTYTSKDGTPQNFGVVNLLNEKSGYDSISYTQLRDLYNSCLLQNKFSSDSDITLSTQKDLANSFNRIQETQRLIKESSENKDLSSNKPQTAFLGRGIKTIAIDLKPVESVDTSINPASLGWSSDVKYIGKVNVPQTDPTSTSLNGITGSYWVGLKNTGNNGQYQVIEAVNSENTKVKLTKEQLQTVKSIYSELDNVQQITAQTYSNQYLKPEVRFYENEPYKGMPSVVPIDLQRGWYAGTRQTLPTLGGIGAFDSSGRVTSFWLCNVGSNGLEQFDQGLGDDICQQFNLNTGQPINLFPRLSEETTRSLVNKAVDSLDQAARQYSNGLRRITISGVGTIEVGAPSVGTPGTNCQDFMSPDDCKILFNVCDPVICPSSRCNFGGAYPVADVIQSGIVGSITLCLPNIREGVAIPICLTGVQAGIDSFVSILKAHRDCLQESVDSGRVTGICDELYSIYACEFFWRQAAPVANLLIPKMIEYAYSGGQGGRGGAEYLSVQSAWNNAQKSVDYLTQNYAKNSFDAFNIRSTEDVGSAFCKNFISARGPSSLKSLVEPDSPPQFHATFSSIKFTDATVPATSQYKVFYHIFSGKDSGVYYSVYLKGAAESSFYNIPDRWDVASGFISRGDFRDETEDFTAPEGYKELCVRINDDEECGFGQVSTSFAVDYIRDEVEKDRLLNTDINSEQACVSGSLSLSGNSGLGGAVGSALTNINPQAAFEEAVTPADYKRGIVRICSSDNPGRSTDPTRFISVGNCGDAKITCWLDQKSVDNAISSNNVGARDETLSALTEHNKQTIEQQGFITENDAAAQINAIKQVVKNFVPTGTIKAAEIINRIDEIYYDIYYNHQKAELLFLKASVLDKDFSYVSPPVTQQAPPLPADTIDDTAPIVPSGAAQGFDLEFFDSTEEGTVLDDTFILLKSNGQSIMQNPDQYVTIERTENNQGYYVVLNNDGSEPVTLSIFIKDKKSFQITEPQILNSLNEKDILNDFMNNYQIGEVASLPYIVKKSEVSASAQATTPTTPAPTTTPVSPYTFVKKGTTQFYIYKNGAMIENIYLVKLDDGTAYYLWYEYGFDSHPIGEARSDDSVTFSFIKQDNQKLQYYRSIPGSTLDKTSVNDFMNNYNFAKSGTDLISQAK